jgi:hypothetical protein
LDVTWDGIEQLGLKAFQECNFIGRGGGALSLCQRDDSGSYRQNEKEFLHVNAIRGSSEYLVNGVILPIFFEIGRILGG